VLTGGDRRSTAVDAISPDIVGRLSLPTDAAHRLSETT